MLVWQLRLVPEFDERRCFSLFLKMLKMQQKKSPDWDNVSMLQCDLTVNAQEALCVEDEL